jgi:hypothetical protein
MADEHILPDTTRRVAKLQAPDIPGESCDQKIEGRSFSDKWCSRVSMLAHGYG